MLPEAFLNELKYRSDIEQVIGGYVQLRRRGRNLTGLCPFHSEKTPSFTVYPENQSFYCFGCGAGGDVISFIRRAENLDYMEAIRFLAARAGMEVPESQMDDTAHRLKMRILEMNREAARYFHQCLMSPTGKAARAYLVGRGLTKATVTRFGLGYAPNSWDSLTGFLRSKGYTVEEMTAGGLAATGKKGGCYDSFRDRVIFPIIDLRGGVIGFGGRIMEGSGPKYLNSPDTPVFKKSRNLFAMNFAKNTKRGELMLAEGYMDVIAMHQAGFDNAVAALGTAFTDEQARLLAQYTDTVVLAGDSDGPGQKAVRRNTVILEKAGIKVRVLTITGAKDPDEFIKKYGAERFELLVEGSKSALDFQIQQLRSRNDVTSAEGRIAFLQEFVRLMAATPSPIQRDVYISKVCRELEVDKQAVVLQLEAALKRKRSGEQKKEARDLKVFTDRDPAGRMDFERQRSPKAALAGERLIAYLMKNPDQVSRVATSVREEQFVSPMDRRLYQLVKERLMAGQPADLFSLSGQVETGEMDRLSAILTVEGVQNISDAEAEDYIRVLQQVGTEKKPEEVGKMEDDELRRYIASLTANKK